MFLYFKEFESVKQGFCAPNDSCLKTIYFGRKFNVLFDNYCYSENVSYNINYKSCKINHDWLNCDSHQKNLWKYVLKKCLINVIL